MVTTLSGQADARAKSLKKRLVRFWNSWDVYWDPISTTEARESPQREKAVSFLPEGGRVLDVACGSAANASLIARRCAYVGADISPTGLHRAMDSALCLVCGDAEQLPFARDTFDATISTFALEHSVNPIRMLQEMHRVVRPGGRIVLLGPSWDLPFWYPNAIQSDMQDPARRVAYMCRRLLGQVNGWVFGRLPFFCVEEPDVFHRELVNDADAVYVVWTYEVIRQMKRFGCRLIHAEADDRMWGTNRPVRLMKRMLYRLPPYQHAGSTVLLVFER
jgi:SAM-dependent methyltransferase